MGIFSWLRRGEAPEKDKQPMAKEPKILVTGSAGYIGSQVVDKLERRGHKVVTFDRADGQDIFDRAELDTALKGVDVVVHLAAYPHRGSLDGIQVDEQREEFYRLNYEGTQNVYSAAADAGVKRFVYCSSGNVYCMDGGDPQEGISGPIGIDQVPEPEDCHPYPASKILSERFLMSTDEDGPELLILRPNWIESPPQAHWLDAQVPMALLLDMIERACVVELPSISSRGLILDAIERNENYLGSTVAYSILFEED